jgi:choline kinase
MWYKLAIQGIIQHQVSDQDIDSLVDQSVMDLGEKYLINQMQLKNGLMSMFPNLKDVLFEDSAESLGEYILELSAIAIPTEIAKNQLNVLKATLHHELQHLQDPRMQKMPEKVKQLSDEANLANYIGIQKVNENTSFPSYEETIEKIFESFIGRRSNPSDEEFLNEIKAKYTPELYQRVMQRIQAGDHPYFNSELEKPANLKDFRTMFSASNLMGIKDLVSKDPSYTNEKHIELISNVLRNPSSKRFNTLESLLIQKYPEFSETYDPSFLKEMNTNPKYERQFYKQLGNIINELQQLSDVGKGN